MTIFRAGGTAAAPHDLGAGPQTFCWRTFQEWHSNIDDAAYLAWSRAVVIRAAYGSQHDDKAWYGGQRRALLHRGGAAFVGMYMYLVAGQDGGAQAQAFHRIVGPIQPGEVFIADFEEGSHAMLTAWYNGMLSCTGKASPRTCGPTRG